MQVTNRDAWVSIRQYRKNLKSNRSFAYVVPHDSQGNSFSCHYRSLSQNKDRDFSVNTQAQEPVTMSKSNILGSLEPSYIEDDGSIGSNTVTNRLHHFASPISKEPKIIVDSLKTNFEISPPTCSGSSTIDQLVSDRNAISSNKGGETLREELGQNERLINAQKSFLTSFRELLEDKTTRREHRKDNILIWDDEESLATKRDETVCPKNDYQNIYKKIEAAVERKYLQKLKEKDNEIKALKLNLAFKAQKGQQQQEKIHPNLKNKIEEYEEVINQMRKAYEEKIVSSEKIYKRKISEFVSERKKLIEEIDDLKGKLNLFVEQSKKEKALSQLTMQDKKKTAHFPEHGKVTKTTPDHHIKPTKAPAEKLNLQIPMPKNQGQTHYHDFSFDKKCMKDATHIPDTKRDLITRVKEKEKENHHSNIQNVNFCGIKAPYNNKQSKRHLHQSIAYFKGEKDNFLHQNKENH